MLQVSTFYHIVNLQNYEDMKPLLLESCTCSGLKGTIILSEEGINATVCGTPSGISSMFDFLNSDERLEGIVPSNTYSDFCPFQHMKVVLKREIVTLGIPGVYARDSANYVDPNDWDDFISRPGIKLIDTRNFYETQLGSFEGALLPCTKNFRDFPGWFSHWTCENNISKDQCIAMFCTGGIRCEKSTSLLRSMGFYNVYHLKGGIISYLARRKGHKQKWFGDCFVFDDRVALTSDLSPSKSVRCGVCGVLVTTDDLKNTTRGNVICLHCTSAIRGGSCLLPHHKASKVNLLC